MAIFEVLEVLSEHEDQWDARKQALREIEGRSNRLQEEIGKAQAKYEKEQAVKRLNQANTRLDVVISPLKWGEAEIVRAQERARKAYQDGEAAMIAAQERACKAFKDAEQAMNTLAKNQERYEEAKAAVEAAEQVVAGLN